MRWGNAVFVAWGETPWTEGEALAFIDRVEQIEVEQCEAAIMAELEPEVAS
jgi:hypothetical protein